MSAPPAEQDTAPSVLNADQPAEMKDVENAPDTNELGGNSRGADSAVTASGDDEFVEEGDMTPGRDGGVVKEVISRGKGWQRAEAGDEVSIMYKGMLTDGTVFDSSYERGSPFQFKLGAGSVIQGWELVARTMAKGEKSRVTMKADYAYGSAGSPPKIPGNATLVFEMELIDFISKKDVMGDGSVFKTELSSGTGWERPSPLSSVSLSVAGVAFGGDGEATENSLFLDTTITCTLGAGQIPVPWEKVVPDMKKGSRLLLACKQPHLLGPGVDEKATLPPGTARVEYTITLDTWVKVEILSSEDSSIIKSVVTEGDGWERPNEGSSVVVDLSYCKAPAGASCLTSKANPDPSVIAAATVVSSESPPVFLEQNGLAFSIGDGAVIDGLDSAVQSMKCNEMARMTIASGMAFETAPDLLPSTAGSVANMTGSDPVVVTVKLLSFEKGKDVWSMSFDEKANEMMKRKLNGNELFNAKRILLATKSYERAIALFDSPTSELTPAVKKRVNQLLVQCHVNLAACFERKGDVAKIVHHCKKALEVEPGNVKALYRRGSALIEMDDYYNAESDLKYALELSPGNTEVKRKLNRLSSLKARQDAKEKRLYSNLFGRLSALEEADKKRVAHVEDSEGGEGEEGC